MSGRKTESETAAADKLGEFERLGAVAGDQNLEAIVAGQGDQDRESGSSSTR